MRCPLCFSSLEFQPLFSHDRTFFSCSRLDSVPNVEKSSNYGCGEAKLDLVQCVECGFIHNKSFDKEQMQKEYSSKGYLSRKIVSKAMSANIKTICEAILNHYRASNVASQTSSKAKIVENSETTQNTTNAALSSITINIFDGANTTTGGGGIIEIAPGSGDLACALAKDCEFLYTIDPSYVSLDFTATNNHLHISSFFMPSAIKKYIKHDIKCIIFRHLLEHIDTPKEFLESVVSLLAQGGIIYVEVPNVLEFFKNRRFYEVLHDHCGYYQQTSLVSALNKLGCRHIDTIMLYGEQHLGLFFKKEGVQISNSKFPILFKDAKNMRQAMQNLNDKLKAYKNVALYGAGAHANSLFSFLSLENKFRISCCYDLDIRKHGKYLQNSNIAIKKPCKENYEGMDCILIAAPLYESEILSFLRKDGFQNDILPSLCC